jgi:hypothetical protein
MITGIQAHPKGVLPRKGSQILRICFWRGGATTVAPVAPHSGGTEPPTRLSFRHEVPKMRPNIKKTS